MNLDTITIDMDVMDKTTIVMTLMVRGSIPRGPTTLSLPCHGVNGSKALLPQKWLSSVMSQSGESRPSHRLFAFVLNIVS
jgi:hypothetical protein